MLEYTGKCVESQFSYLKCLGFLQNETVLSDQVLYTVSFCKIFQMAVVDEYPCR